jgi:membrane-bound lytic murein transglycosylase D
MGVGQVQWSGHRSRGQKPGLWKSGMVAPVLGLAFLFGVSEAGWGLPAGAELGDSAPQKQVESEGFVFDSDPEVQRKVQFWIQIYTKYPSSQGLIHDAKYIDRVYEVVDLSGDPRTRTQKIRQSKKHWRSVLLAVHQKQNHPERMTAEEQRIFELFRNVDEPHPFLNATHRKRLRFQLGQKDRFLEGLIQSGRYLNQMEAIFKREGMPLELTRLPFVESSFNLKARSKVGASGVWQFMRSTARLFIRMNAALDERNDPVRATEAAARLLKLNYESLKSWPLAVTAYNHGRKGMMRAVRKVGSDKLSDLIADYKSRSFGFASSNFYAELLAAIEVEKNAEAYFGQVERAPAVQAQEFEVPRGIPFRKLSEALVVPAHELKELNPALSPAVLEGAVPIPKGYRLRLPGSFSEEEFQRHFNYDTDQGLGRRVKKAAPKRS